ncbi:MAG: hypothetical protein IH897_14665, partial [Planctomycetes bacterium]|nr:hypothetical protein [Planctomycetota bacterium]
MALGVSLVLSALLTAATLRSPNLHWLAWFSFLPLFVVVRWLRPMMAALAGGLWGACLYSFLTAGAAPEVAAVSTAIAPSGRLLVLFIAIPTVYVGLAARPAWAIGFKLVMLALGWAMVEAVLHLSDASGPHEGLLTGSQGEGLHFHWLARLFGYVATSFLVACANASLVGVVIRARLRFPDSKL